MTTTREAALEAALTLARNRLQACAIDHPTGSREMYERSEWADEATAALATPAPSDKIAEAARDKTAAELVIDAYDAANLFREADMHPALCHCNRCAIDWMRALAGQGETP